MGWSKGNIPPGRSGGVKNFADTAARSAMLSTMLIASRATTIVRSMVLRTTMIAQSTALKGVLTMPSKT